MLTRNDLPKRVPEVGVEDGVDDGVQRRVDVAEPRDEADQLKRNRFILPQTSNVKTEVYDFTKVIEFDRCFVLLSRWWQWPDITEVVITIYPLRHHFTEFLIPINALLHYFNEMKIFKCKKCQTACSVTSDSPIVFVYQF